jgi:hypothetical protein
MKIAWQRTSEEVVLEINKLELWEIGNERGRERREEEIPREIKNLYGSRESERGAETSEVIVIDIKVCERDKTVQVTWERGREEIAI